MATGGDTPRHVNDYTRPWDKSDVTFNVDNNKLYFNRAVLAFHSAVFDRMFNSEFRESDPEKEIPLPGKMFQDVQAMLLILKSCPGASSPVTESNLVALLKMSDEYEMRHVALECEKFILADWASDGSKHCLAVDLAFTHRLHAVAKSFMPLAACRRLEEIDKFAGRLPTEAYAAILHAHLLRTRTGAFGRKDRLRPGMINVEIPGCTVCYKPRFFVSNGPEPGCVCTNEPPTDDPIIQGVLARFLQVCMRY